MECVAPTCAMFGDRIGPGPILVGDVGLFDLVKIICQETTYVGWSASR
jgi:hypothetical protein